MGSIRAELALIGRRLSTWGLLALALAMGVLFNYVFPYVSYLDKAADKRNPADLAKLLPHALVTTAAPTFPFYFGTFALILGVLLLGSDYGWGTLKTVLMQQPNRLRLFAAKLIALAAVLAVYVLAIFATMAVSSTAVALREGTGVSWPDGFDILRALAAGWLILSVWGMLGVLLGVLWRGTALPIGLGILYGLVIEGLISGFASSIDLLMAVAHVFLRTNGYSLVAALDGSTTSVGGPGAFSGPFVGVWQALAMLLAYLAIFGIAAAAVLQRRDVG